MKTTDKTKEYILKNYELKTNLDMAKELNVSVSHIRYVSEKILKIVKGSGRWGKREERREIISNDNLFDKWNRKNSYILGFLVADGHVEENRNRITLGLSIKDIDLLYKIRDIVSPNSNIRKYFIGIHECCELRFTSEKICSFLRNLGFIHNKTGNEPILLNSIPKKYHYDYLRGIIDGDGCIYTNQRVRTIKNEKYWCKDNVLSIVCKNINFLENIKSVLCNKYGTIDNYNRNYYTYRIFDRKQIVDICNLVYKNIDNELYLKRKFDKYLTIKSWSKDD